MSTARTPIDPDVAPGRTVAVATCRDAWRADEDAPLLIDALARIGVTATEQVWDDASVDWAAFDLVVVRSTWDYALRRDEFLDWTRRVESSTELRNTAPVIAWNTDKRYLAALGSSGVPVVPTHFLDPSDHDLATDDVDALAGRIATAVDGAPGFVVKPTVSAGSKDTVRYAVDPGTAVAAAAAQAADLLADGRAVMVQPYLDAVDTDGDTGLLFFGGRFSHAFRKGQLLTVGGGPVTGLYMAESIEPRVATSAQIRVAELVLDAARAETGVHELYARVDLIPDDHGDPVLLELELTEPSFFLTTDAGSADRAAAAIADAIPRT